MPKELAVLLCSFSLIVSTPPSTFEESSRASDAGEFRLVVLNQDWETLGLRYEAEAALLKLQAVNTADCLFVIGVDEIESYRWATQSITLTPEATRRFAAALPARHGPVEALNDMKRKLGESNELSLSLQQRAFVATVGGRTIYGGIFLDAESQMAIDYPVIRAEIRDDKAVLNLLPVHVPFTSRDPVSDDGMALEPTVESAGAEGWSQVPDGLMRHFLSLATTPHAKKLRRTIRSGAVREIVAGAGKLIE